MRKPKLLTTKNKLIKKFAEHVPRDDYRITLGSKKHGTGIYILYKNDKVYYIGLSKRSLRGRLRSHARNGHRRKWNNFSFYQVKKKRYIKDIESLLLRIIRPKGNKVKGKFLRKYRIKV